MLRLMTGKYQAAIATGLAKLTFAFMFNGVSYRDSYLLPSELLTFTAPSKPLQALFHLTRVLQKKNA